MFLSSIIRIDVGKIADGIIMPLVKGARDFTVLVRYSRYEHNLGDRYVYRTPSIWSNSQAVPSELFRRPNFSEIDVDSFGHDFLVCFIYLHMIHSVEMVYAKLQKVESAHEMLR